MLTLQCMTSNLLGSLHRLSPFMVTLYQGGSNNTTLTFTDEKTDEIQILLIYLDHLVGIRLHALTLIILFIQKSFIEYPTL